MTLASNGNIHVTKQTVLVHQYIGQTNSLYKFTVPMVFAFSKHAFIHLNSAPKTTNFITIMF